MSSGELFSVASGVSGVEHPSLSKPASHLPFDNSVFDRVICAVFRRACCAYKSGEAPEVAISRILKEETVMLAIFLDF